jgi:hypothetical protein
MKTWRCKLDFEPADVECFIFIYPYIRASLIWVVCLVCLVCLLSSAENDVIALHCPCRHPVNQATMRPLADLVPEATYIAEKPMPAPFSASSSMDLSDLSLEGLGRRNIDSKNEGDHAYKYGKSPWSCWHSSDHRLQHQKAITKTHSNTNLSPQFITWSPIAKEACNNIYIHI